MSARIDEPLDDAGVLHLVLDAPKGNVLDLGMIGRLTTALHTGVTSSTRVVCFEGAGKHFSFGASVAEHRRAEAAAMLAAFHGLFRLLAELAVPTAAIVRGQCLGGGLELASWCTWVFASPDARLGQPEIRLAVFPPMASLVLPWRVGGGRALDLCVSGRTIGAEEARSMGLVTEVAADPRAAFDAFYEEHVAAASASSLRFAERAARGTLLEALRVRLPALERLYLDELMATHDANEGIEAFLDRRPPSFDHA